VTPINGLVLAGGRSRRMHADKAALTFSDRPQLALAFELVAAVTRGAWISVRGDQVDEALRARYPQVVDGRIGEGPIAGIVAAQQMHPDAAWLVIACDLPYLGRATLDELVAGRDPARLATAFRSASDGLPEPLCALYEPGSRVPILDYIAAGGSCPRKFLLSHDVHLLDAADARALGNANTPQDLDAARAALAARGAA